MAKKPKNLTHTYRIPHLANKSKVQAISVLYAVYSREFHTLITQRFKQYLQGIPRSLSYLGSTKEVITPLSQSQYQGCLARVCDALKSHVALLHDRVLVLANKSSLCHTQQALYDQVRYLCRTRQIKSQLAGEFYTAGYNLVTDDYGNCRAVPNRSGWQALLTPEAIRLANSLFAKARTLIRFPDVEYPRMVLDSRTVTLAPSEVNHAGITHWAEISLLPLPKTEKAKPKKERAAPLGYSNGNKLAIPLYMHEYAKEAPGIVTNSLELIVRDNTLQFALWKKATPAEYKAWHFAEACEPRKDSPAVVAFDMGLCTLLASSEGDCYGRYWLDKLTEYDRRLTELTAQRQRLGLKHYGTRQQGLIQQIRGFIKTEIGRIVNAWVRCHSNVETIVLEALNLTSSGLSRKMNRLIRQAGLPRLKAKFKELAPCYGFTVEEVQPAYTSRECRHCGWVSGNNRAKQKTFNCELCGKTNHADAHASVTVLGRSRDGLGGLTKQATLVHLRDRLLANLSGRVFNC